MEKLKKIFATRKSKIVGVIIILFILIVIVPSFSDKKISLIKTSKINQIVTSVPVDPAVLEAERKQLVELKKKFDYSYDEFEKTSWYRNKSQSASNTYNKKLLKVIVDELGDAYLGSQYVGDDWIFHTRAEVKIGDIIYKTDDYLDPNRKVTNSGIVLELIGYPKDNGIIRAIAESGNTPVKVRFTGGDGYYDFTLEKIDQQAIRDAYELSGLIKKVGDTGTIPQL